MKYKNVKRRGTCFNQLSPKSKRNIDLVFDDQGITGSKRTRTICTSWKSNETVMPSTQIGSYSLSIYVRTNDAIFLF